MSTKNLLGLVSIKELAKSLLSTAIFLFTFQSVQAQCPQSLGCNDNIQISLDYECYAEITPSLILEDERINCDYYITILTANDIVLQETTVDMMGNFVYPVIDGSYVGQPYKASVHFFDTNNTRVSCWGWFTVEDKLPPSVTCIDDITVDCSADLSDLLTSRSIITYCTDTPIDVDSDPSTISLVLTPAPDSDPVKGWEIIEHLEINVPLTPLTGSGAYMTYPGTASGTGIFALGGGAYSFNPDPVDNSIYTGQIMGVQASEENLTPSITLVIENSPANNNAIANGLCVDINTSSFFLFQEMDNCDPNIDVIINKDVTTNLECSTTNLTAQRDIEYYTRDNSGLTTDICDFSIFFEKKTLADLEFPPNAYFDCGDPAILEDGIVNLDPENTGEPTIDGYPLSDEDNYCRINVTFADDTFSLCGSNTIKILRKWTALDWCAGDYAQSYQTIKVEDNDAPDIECPDDGLVFEASNDCSASIIFKPLDSLHLTGLKSYFDCADVSVEVEFLQRYGITDIDAVDYREFTPAIYGGQDSGGFDMFIANNLQSGKAYIRYIVSDACGNESECRFEINIIDSAPPIAICDQFTAVSIANNGWARLYAAAIDDGSYDECGGPVEIAIKRDSSICFDLPESERNDTIFGEYIQFCCQEAGETIPVTLRVTDAGQRTNTCVVSVIVQDKSGYELISCPSILTANLDCSQSTDIDTSIMGYPVIGSDCGTGSLRFEDSGTLDDICGNGTIVRSWFVDTPNGSEELVSCRQTFNFTSNITFNINSFDWPDDRDDATCSNFTTDLGDAVMYNGVPVNEADVCGHLSYSYEDRVFESVEGYCVKVIRTWTVIDFCNYDPHTQSGSGIWSRNQVIKVSSMTGPTLLDCPANDTLNIDNSACEVFLNYDAPMAYDSCFQEFIPSSDFIFTIRENGNIVTSGFGDIDNLPIGAGDYEITWSIEGLCGNIASCSYNVFISDTKAPTPYCLGGVTTVLTPPQNPNEEPSLEIWASDFDLGSNDNCDNDVHLSFDPLDLTLTSIQFTCEDLGIQPVTIWVTDNSGNQDFCTTMINIQANGDICPDTIGTGMIIAGTVATEFNEEIGSIEVGLMSMIDSEMNYDLTNVNGEYAFYNAGEYQDYQLNVLSDDDYLNGVSTLDLIIIQRHILGLEALDSPYKMVAADINNNQDISAIDLIELRKLILGIYEELPQNESWRFIDRAQNFPDINHPWPLKESIDIYDIQVDEYDHDFVAVKTGDVNGSVNLTSGETDIVSRSTTDAEMSHDILQLSQNGDYLIPVYFKEDQELMGLQAQFEFDASTLKIVDVESGRLNIEKENFVVIDNLLRISWAESSSVTSLSDDALFYITVNSSYQLNEDVLKVSQKGGFNSELYTRDLQIVNIDIDKRENNFSNKLYQNVPNPFSQFTKIEFDLARSANVKLSIFDASGKLVRMVNDYFEKGNNNILVNYNDLNGDGIYYYQLDTEFFTATRKMILIE